MQPTAQQSAVYGMMREWLELLCSPKASGFTDPKDEAACINTVNLQLQPYFTASIYLLFSRDRQSRLADTDQLNVNQTGRMHHCNGSR